MLNVPVPFPHPGSTAYLVPNAQRPRAERVRVVQHKPATDEVLVARDVPDGGRAARMEFYARGATRDLTVRADELRETHDAAARASAPIPLKPHRKSQLQLLAADGAVSRHTAVAVALGNNRFEYRCGILSAMVGEGLVENAYLPFNGDARRRVSHYWLTARGQQAAGQ